MTTDSAPSGLQPFSHLKAGPTTFSSRSTAVPASPSTPTALQSGRRAQQAKSIGRDEQLNGTGDKATVALIRRVLCPQSGSYGGATSPYTPEELLPPLTSSNDVDRQLYALIAIIIKEFILSWYSKITPDQALTNEVLQLIAHCTRALEQRLRQVDIAQLVLDDIPALVEAHVVSYKMAKEQSISSGLSPSSREIYHAINPHPGLSPIPNASDAKSTAEQQENETAYRRLLVDGVLAILLPTEDLENACLQILLSDILADLMLGNEVSGKVCEGWFLWECTAKLLDVLSKDNSDQRDRTESPPRNQLQEFGLLSNPDSENNDSFSTAQSRTSSWIWLIIQYAFFAYVTLRFIVVGLFRNASVHLTWRPSPPKGLIGEEAPKCGDIRKRPVLDYRLYGMVSQLLDIPQRMPWLGGLLALFQHFILAGPGQVGDTDSVLDRFLHEIIEEYVITPTLLPKLLRASREALFPQNARTKPGASASRIETPTPPTPGVQPSTVSHTQTTTSASGGNAATPAVIVTNTEGSPSLPSDQQRRPSTAEVASIRRRCALGIVSLVPRPIARRVLGIPADIDPREKSIPTQSRAQSPDQVQESTSDAREPPLHLSQEAPLHDELNRKDDLESEEELLASAIETDILDLFADEYCNKHLIFSIIEAVLAKLLPELSGRSIVELMEDRAVFVPPGE
ncbi:PXA domain-containing protein [Aspergillus unguis]